MFGDTVYLRVADNPAEEAAAAMVSMRGTQALLAVPPAFSDMVAVSSAIVPSFSWTSSPFRCTEVMSCGSSLTCTLGVSFVAHGK